jgi:hypothetical protein
VKEEEVRKHIFCDRCGRRVAVNSKTSFYVVKIEKYELDTEALRRNAALVEMLGGSVSLARAMGPDEDMAKPVKEKELTLCGDCFEDEGEFEEGQAVRRCRVCGCTDDDCRQCIEKTGKPCHWVEPDLCSACAGEKGAEGF